MLSIETGSLPNDIPNFDKSNYGKIESKFSTAEEINNQQMNSELLYSGKKLINIEPITVNDLKKKWWKYLIILILVVILKIITKKIKLIFIRI